MVKSKTKTAPRNLDELCIDTIRYLSLDMVERAKSGHPGTPMGAADFAYILWDRFLKHNPRDPRWADRDRFVLSPGHASAMLYSLLYLTGYNLPMSQLKEFRQWGSMTPGHPEYGTTPGVAATTGPLGQGFANGVGMAIAENWMAEHYDRPGHEVVDHFTYAIVSDGDMQEGVTSEAASLAGTLKLRKLIYMYDANDVQIEGSTKIAFRENVARRFEAYGWRVIGPVRGDDRDAVDGALRQARAEPEKPSLIICHTIIGHYSPLQGTAKAHSDPMSREDVERSKEAQGWPLEPSFYVPPEALKHFREAIERGRKAEEEWTEDFRAYSKAFPDLAKKLRTHLEGRVPRGWDEGLGRLFNTPSPEPMATRDASGAVLNALEDKLHTLAGGSADLSPSTKSYLVGYGNFGWQEHYGNNIHFGVREHAMGSIANGMSLHGGVIPYTATFLAFSDYMRPPLRLAAMMKIRVIFIFTHDSIGLGQDGPTHQPIEQLMSLRTIPNMTVIRPADATETVEAWRSAILDAKGPTSLIFSRQKLPVIDRKTYASASGARKGAYILWENAEGKPEVILIGTGSEVHIALAAGLRLAKEGRLVRVVSMPSWELFDAQHKSYREQVLPPSVKARVAVEAGTVVGWERYVGLGGKTVGMKGFGASAPGEVLYEKFGITPVHVEREAQALLEGRGMR